MTTNPPSPRQWYRIPLRMPLWFGLVLLAGWGVVFWRGIVASIAPVAATDVITPPSGAMPSVLTSTAAYRPDNPWR